MAPSAADLPIAQGLGSVSGAPNLPTGFTDTFTSRYIDTGELRLHAVIGGEGPPLLLVHGWPGSWYYWRLVMPALAREFEVIAVDQRGIGLSDKPEKGYDTGTVGNDLPAMMDALGHQRFALVGVDTGMLIAYAVAADHPDRVDRLVVGEAPLPGITPPTPLILPDLVKARLWHIPFNQQDTVNEQLVAEREDDLLRRGVRRVGRKEQAPAVRRRLLRRGPLRPRRAARELPALSRVLQERHPERRADEAAAEDAGPGDRRGRKQRQRCPRTRWNSRPTTFRAWSIAGDRALARRTGPGADRSRR